MSTPVLPGPVLAVDIADQLLEQQQQQQLSLDTEHAAEVS